MAACRKSGNGVWALSPLPHCLPSTNTVGVPVTPIAAASLVVNFTNGRYVLSSTQESMFTPGSEAIFFRSLSDRPALPPAGCLADSALHKSEYFAGGALTTRAGALAARDE